MSTERPVGLRCLVCSAWQVLALSSSSDHPSSLPRRSTTVSLVRALQEASSQPKTACELPAWTSLGK